ncbi:MAG: hypothetical protein ACKO7W_20950 [Elainella sp.]
MSAKKRPPLMSKPQSAQRPVQKAGANLSKPAQQTSAALRTLRAKLQILKRPTVWGSLLLLLLPLLFLANYWNNLAQSEVSSSTALPAAPSPEATSEATAEATSANPLPSPDFLKGLFGAGQAGQAAGQAGQSANSGREAKPSQTAPVAVPALPPVGLSTANTANTANCLAGSASDATAATPVSPLQAALDRRDGVNGAERNSAGGPASTSASTSTSSSQAGTPSANVSRLYEFGSSTASQPGATPTVLPGFGQPFVPQTSPAAGTTGYTLPPALRTPTSLTSPQLLPATPTLQPTQLPMITAPNQAGYSAPTPVPTVVAPAPQVPFSVPRVPPGRYIGNGQINTFSNP